MLQKKIRPTHMMSQHGLDDNIVLFLQMETWGREVYIFLKSYKKSVIFFGWSQHFMSGPLSARAICLFECNPTRIKVA